MKIKYLLLDLDGCVGSGKGHLFHLPQVQQLREQLANAPFATGICTGRSAAYVEAITQLLDIKHWCICENGAYLFHPVTEAFIFHPAISATAKHKLQTLKTDLQRRHDDANDVFSHINVEYGKELCVSLNCPDWSMDKLLRVVREEVDTTGLHLGHSATAIDLTPEGINKGSGVRFLSEHLGIALSDMAAIGDSSGDIPTFDLVGMTACPANACDAIKARSQYCASQEEIFGTLEIMSMLINPTR